MVPVHPSPVTRLGHGIGSVSFPVPPLLASRPRDERSCSRKRTQRAPGRGTGVWMVA